MAQRGKASIAHQYDEQHACIHCGMYQVNVEKMNHVCKPWRELEVDMEEADKAGLSLSDYRMGDEHGQ